MNPGGQRGRIEIQKAVHKEDCIGNQIVEWTQHYQCRAYINNLSGSEYWEAAQLNGKLNLIFTVRYCRSIKEINKTAYRILWDGKECDITHIDNVQYKNQTVKIHATVKE